MNIWTKRILGALPLLGCGAGITAVAQAMSNTPLTVANGIIYALFTLFYLAGAVAGMMLLEGHRNALTANFFYWLVQTLHFYSYVFSFLLWAPFNLGTWWNITTAKVGMTAQAGSTFYFSFFNRNAELAFELNALAIACCVCIFMEYRRVRRREGSVAREPEVVEIPQAA